MTAVAILQNHALQAIRNFVGRMMLGLAPVQRKLVNQMTEVSIGYDTSPLNGPAARGVGGPEPGERVAPRDGETPFGFGRAPRFALCAGEDESVRRLLAEFPNLLDPELRSPRDPAGMLLVRPDGYAAASAKIGDDRPLAEYLRNLNAAATNSR